jgi:hypothetical protein
MKRYLGFVASVVLPLSLALPSAKALHAVDTDAYTLTINGGSPITGGVLTFSDGVWTSDTPGSPLSTTLPDGTFFDGSDPLNIDLKLTDPITLGNNITYGFGLGGIDPEIPTNGFVFDFGVTLLDQGSVVAGPLGFGVFNSFGYSIDNIGTGSTSTITGGPIDEIDIEVTGQRLETDPQVGNFGVNVGDVTVAVPDNGTTLALLALGLAGIGAFARRSRLVPQKA